ncbi:hypothetical protein B0H13DRAFT_2047164, partial [Mycena leptocephala]
MLHCILHCNQLAALTYASAAPSGRMMHRCIRRVTTSSSTWLSLDPAALSSGNLALSPRRTHGPSGFRNLHRHYPSYRPKRNNFLPS